MIGWREILENLPRVALNILPGFLSGGSRVGKALNAAAGRKIKGATFTYPGLTEEFNYPINYVGGDTPFYNASLIRELAYKGALAQSLEEHNQASAAGKEGSLQSWWPGKDNKPRVDFMPGSSAVSGVKILPNNKIQVQFRGGGKWYTYRGGSNPREASEAAKDLLTSPSIGRAIAHSDKEGTDVGAWCRQHFDPSEVR